MKDNLFGTDGIRAKIGTDPLTQQALAKLGSAIAQWAITHFGPNTQILLGHDTRESCHWVKAALQSGLLLHSISLYDAQIITTPALSKIVYNSTQFTVGIIISASHNPYYDNGIKIVTTQGKILYKDELEITNLFYAPERNLDYTIFGTYINWPQAHEYYCSLLYQYFPHPFLSNKKIILDCAQGASTSLAPYIFSHLGAQVITINNQPDGKNINHQCGALHMESLQAAVLNHQADIGFAFDGDGDRVLIVNKQGQVKDGDDILALLLDHPLYMHESTIVGTSMSNHGFSAFLHSKGKKLLRTAVGDKYVSEELLHNNVLLGGEQSGHIILRDYMNSGDGIFTALRIMQTVLENNNWNLNTFTKFPQILINIPVKIKHDLSLPPFASIIEHYETQLNQGRLLVRYSGTEPLLRIMIEDSDSMHAHAIGNALSTLLAAQLQ